MIILKACAKLAVEDLVNDVSLGIANDYYIHQTQEMFTPTEVAAGTIHCALHADAAEK